MPLPVLPGVPPKTRSIRLLINDVLEDGVGGGGTTGFETSGTLPLDRRRRSCDMSAEGGGATTAGAGMASLALRDISRSGAETGGGTTAAVVICTGACDKSRLTAAGAGGTTPGVIDGAVRA